MDNTPAPPAAKHRFRPFRARLANGHVQVRMQLTARAQGYGNLPDVMTDMSWQLSLPHARLLHGALGAALADAAAAGLLDEQP